MGKRCRKVAKIVPDERQQLIPLALVPVDDLGEDIRDLANLAEIVIVNRGPQPDQ